MRKITHLVVVLGTVLTVLTSPRLRAETAVPPSPASQLKEPTVIVVLKIANEVKKLLAPNTDLDEVRDLIQGIHKRLDAIEVELRSISAAIKELFPYIEEKLEEQRREELLAAITVAVESYPDWHAGRDLAGLPIALLNLRTKARAAQADSPIRNLSGLMIAFAVERNLFRLTNAPSAASASYANYARFFGGVANANLPKSLAHENRDAMQLMKTLETKVKSASPHFAEEPGRPRPGVYVTDFHTAAVCLDVPTKGPGYFTAYQADRYDGSLGTGFKKSDARTWVPVSSAVFKFLDGSIHPDPCPRASKYDRNVLLPGSSGFTLEELTKDSRDYQVAERQHKLLQPMVSDAARLAARARELGGTSISAKEGTGKTD